MCEALTELWDGGLEDDRGVLGDEREEREEGQRLCVGTVWQDGD